MTIFVLIISKTHEVLNAHIVLNACMYGSMKRDFPLQNLKEKEDLENIRFTSLGRTRWKQISEIDNIRIVYKPIDLQNAQCLLNSSLEKVKDWSGKISLAANAIKTKYLLCASKRLCGYFSALLSPIKMETNYSRFCGGVSIFPSPLILYLIYKLS